MEQKKILFVASKSEDEDSLVGKRSIIDAAYNVFSRSSRGYRPCYGRCGSPPDKLKYSAASIFEALLEGTKHGLLKEWNGKDRDIRSCFLEDRQFSGEVGDERSKTAGRSEDRKDEMCMSEKKVEKERCEEDIVWVNGNMKNVRIRRQRRCAFLSPLPSPVFVPSSLSRKLLGGAASSAFPVNLTPVNFVCVVFENNAR